MLCCLVYQLQLLSELLGVSRMGRLEHMERNHHYEAVLWGMISMLQEGLFQELQDARADISPRRQALQRAYIESMSSHVRSESPSIRLSMEQLQRFPSQYVKSECRLGLRKLQKKLKMVIKKLEDGHQKEHFKACLNMINSCL